MDDHCSPHEVFAPSGTVSKHSAGSALVKVGKTKVLAAVTLQVYMLTGIDMRSLLRTSTIWLSVYLVRWGNQGKRRLLMVKLVGGVR